MGFNDTLSLIEKYELELDWFLSELIQNKNKNKIEDELRLADILSACMNVGSKKGNQIFNKWRRDKIHLLKELNQEEKEVTIFEKLKVGKSGKTNTIFDRLKYFFKEK